MAKFLIDGFKTGKAVFDWAAELENDLGNDISLSDLDSGGFVAKNRFEIGADVVEARFEEMGKIFAGNGNSTFFDFFSHSSGDVFSAADRSFFFEDDFVGFDHQTGVGDAREGAGVAFSNKTRQKAVFDSIGKSKELENIDDIRKTFADLFGNLMIVELEFLFETEKGFSPFDRVEIAALDVLDNSHL